jgi:hypothetical protein
MIFPNIYKALANDEFRPAMNYAIIDDGKIVATNGCLLIASDFHLFVDNPELAVGKVFDKNLLRWMAKKDFKQLECTETGIIAYKKRCEKEEKPYSGYFRALEKESRAIFLYSDERKKIGNYPNWKSVIPDDSKYKEATGIKSIGFDTTRLSIIADCFIADSKELTLKFEFWAEDRVIRVSAQNGIYNRSGKQVAILSPSYISE